MKIHQLINSPSEVAPHRATQPAASGSGLGAHTSAYESGDELHLAPQSVESLLARAPSPMQAEDTVPYADLEQLMSGPGGAMPLRQLIKSVKIKNIDELEYVVQNLPHIQTVDLSAFPHLGDKDLAKIKKCTDIQVLNLSNSSRITITGIKHITSLTKLRHLNLSNCVNITDACLKSLNCLPDLEYFNINFCKKITDKGIAQVSFHANLKQFASILCDNVTPGAIVALKQALPHCEFVALQLPTARPASVRP